MIGFESDRLVDCVGREFDCESFDYCVAAMNHGGQIVLQDRVLNGQLTQ